MIPRTLVFLAMCFATLAASRAARAAGDAPPTQALFERRCLDCHDADTKKGNLDLAALSTNFADPATFARWVKLYDLVQSGEMPPKDKPRPEPAETEHVLSWLSGQLVEAEAARRGDSGRATFRRLTRVEYEHTIQDLFAMPGMPVRDDLPPDGTLAGFNKIGEALDVSHVQMARYLDIAQRVIDRAVATRPDAPVPIKRRLYGPTQYAFWVGLLGGDCVLLNDKKADPAFPVFEEEAVAKEKQQWAVGCFRSTDQAFKPQFDEFKAILPGRYRLRISVWSFWWDKGQVLPSKRTQVVGIRTSRGVIGFFDAPSIDSTVHEVEAWLEPGDSLFFNTSSLEHVRIYGREGGAAKYEGPGIAIDWLEVEGPLNARWPSAGHTALFGDLPVAKLEKLQDGSTAPDRNSQGNPKEHGPVDGVWTVTSQDPKADARRLLKSFLPRAFRRPVADEQFERYADMVEHNLAAGDCFENAMRQAYLAALCSPEFLFRIEPARGPLDDWAVANRLSYFLWNSMPDDELQQLAAAGELSKGGEPLRRQVRRMLADPRFERFVSDFLDQWLSLSEVMANTPDQELYPEFIPYMQDCMLAETRAFFRHLVSHNLGVANLVQSDFAMLNAELGELYGIANAPPGHMLSVVPLPQGSRRGGVITQASVLKLTANGTTTSPIKRGAWVTDRLLGQPPDPPPPSVSAIDPDVRGATTIREQLALHRNNATCTTCHAKIDPPGFALESYDVIGRWRDRYRSKEQGDPVDAKVAEGHHKVKYKLGLSVNSTGVTADGAAFKNVDEFKAILLKDERQIARNLLRRLTLYATGGDVGFADRAVIERILNKCGELDRAGRPHGGAYRVRSLVEELVLSEVFLTK